MPGEDKRKDHIHCAECFHPIYPDQESHTGQTVVWIPGPSGLEPTPRPVPVCQTCWQMIKGNRLEQSLPKLIVPKHNGG